MNEIDDAPQPRRNRIDGFEMTVIHGKAIVIDDTNAYQATNDDSNATWVRVNTTDPLHIVVGDTVIRINANPPRA